MSPLIWAAEDARYPESGSLVPTPVTVEATVDVPILPADLPAPPAN